MQFYVTRIGQDEQGEPQQEFLGWIANEDSPKVLRTHVRHQASSLATLLEADGAMVTEIHHDGEPVAER